MWSGGSSTLTPRSCLYGSFGGKHVQFHDGKLGCEDDQGFTHKVLVQGSVLDLSRVG